jgi:hypothetical protein
MFGSSQLSLRARADRPANAACGGIGRPGPATVTSREVVYPSRFAAPCLRCHRFGRVLSGTDEGSSWVFSESMLVTRALGTASSAGAVGMEGSHGADHSRYRRGAASRDADQATLGSNRGFDRTAPVDCLRRFGVVVAHLPEPRATYRPPPPRVPAKRLVAQLFGPVEAPQVHARPTGQEI